MRLLIQSPPPPLRLLPRKKDWQGVCGGVYMGALDCMPDAGEMRPVRRENPGQIRPEGLPGPQRGASRRLPEPEEKEASSRMSCRGATSPPPLRKPSLGRGLLWHSCHHSQNTAMGKAAGKALPTTQVHQHKSSWGHLLGCFLDPGPGSRKRPLLPPECIPLAAPRATAGQVPRCLMLEKAPSATGPMLLTATGCG